MQTVSGLNFVPCDKPSPVVKPGEYSEMMAAASGFLASFLHLSSTEYAMVPPCVERASLALGFKESLPVLSAGQYP